MIALRNVSSKWKEIEVVPDLFVITRYSLWEVLPSQATIQHTVLSSLLHTSYVEISTFMFSLDD